jgi:putative membrane protein
MWWPVLGPIPDLPKLTPLMGMGYLFLQSLIPTIPASFLTFADEPVYEIYETLPRLWGLSALDDQLIAGLIMKIGGGAVLWTAIAVIFFRWAFEEERAAGARRLHAPS